MIIRCNEVGHLSRECGGGAGGAGPASGAQSCYKFVLSQNLKSKLEADDLYRCNELGHISRNCPQNGGGQQGGYGGGCWLISQFGLFETDI